MLIGPSGFVVWSCVHNANGGVCKFDASCSTSLAFCELWLLLLSSDSVWFSLFLSLLLAPTRLEMFPTTSHIDFSNRADWSRRFWLDNFISSYPISSQSSFITRIYPFFLPLSNTGASSDLTSLKAFFFALYSTAVFISSVHFSLPLVCCSAVTCITFKIIIIIIIIDK